VFEYPDGEIKGVEVILLGIHFSLIVHNKKVQVERIQ